MNEVTAIILAGGKSKRIGQDKAFLNLGNKFLVEIVIDTICDLFKEVLVITNSPKAYQQYKDRVILKCDLIAGRGPLGGIYTGLLFSNNRYNFVVGCDMPFLSKNLLSYIVENPGNFEAVVPEYRGRLHPLCSLYSKSCLSKIESQVKNGNLKMRDLLKLVKTKVINESDIKKIDPKGVSFININTKEEYELHCKDS